MSTGYRVPVVLTWSWYIQIFTTHCSVHYDCITAGTKNNCITGGSKMTAWTAAQRKDFWCVKVVVFLRVTMTVMRIMIAVGTAQLTIKVKRIVVRFQSLHGYNDIKHDINDANNGKLVKAFVYYDLHQDYLGDETPFCLYLILMETVWFVLSLILYSVLWFLDQLHFSKWYYLSYRYSMTTKEK